MQTSRNRSVTGNRRRRVVVLVTLGLVCLLAGLAVRNALYRTANQSTDSGAPDRRGINAPFITTSDQVLEAMIQLADLDAEDLVYDLGCGDGRIVITAVLASGCRGVGFDIDPERVAEARANVKLHAVEDRVKIVEQDLFTVDLSHADVSMMYLLPWMVNKLLPQFEQMKPGCRIVSHDFWIDGVRPDQVVRCPNEDGSIQTIYCYTTPLEKSPALEPGTPPMPKDPPPRAERLGDVEQQEAEAGDSVPRVQERTWPGKRPRSPAYRVVRRFG